MELRLKYDKLNLCEIKNFPLHLLPENCSKAYLGSYFSSQESKCEFVKLFYAIEPACDSIFLPSPVKEVELEMSGTCFAHDCFYKNQTITLVAAAPKLANVINEIKLSDQQLKVENYYIEEAYEYDYDLIEKEKEIARKNDDPIAYYCSNTAPYHTISNDVYLEILEWSHRKALKLYTQKKYKEASELWWYMHEKASLMNDQLEKIIPEKFKRIWGDVTLFHLKAGDNISCCEISELLLEKYPDYTSVYLQYGDALFNLKKWEESEKAYKKYTELMDKEGKKTKIPQRVLIRLNKDQEVISKPINTH